MTGKVLPLRWRDPEDAVSGDLVAIGAAGALFTVERTVNYDRDGVTEWIVLVDCNVEAALDTLASAKAWAENRNAKMVGGLLALGARGGDGR